MLIVTTDGVAGCEITNVFGEVLGTAVRADSASAQAGAPQPGHGGSSATFRVTGEQPAVDLAAVRREAVERLGEEARRKGANTVVGMRFDTTVVGGGVEVCAYGTAVWVQPRDQAQQHPHAQQHKQVPPYGDPQPGGPPMVARNLTMGIHDRPR